MTFATWFAKFSGHTPHPWQQELAEESSCGSRLIRIPTGFGKTLGVVGAWAYQRCILGQPDWPRRLIYCLPMRVLAEQTEREVRDSLKRVGLLRSATNPSGVAVHVLMGGIAAEQWHLDVGGNAILIGTQDMLLSRALNRGYGAPRARWPIEFGLLHHDALWVLDEVQLMDVGLATTGQLETFRAEDAAAQRMLRPAHSWWMSATLQPEWLRSVDTEQLVQSIEPRTLRIPPPLRSGALWTEVQKPVTVVRAASNKLIVQEIVARVCDALAETRPGQLTLVVLNTVDRAVATYQALLKNPTAAGRDIQLVHSRFRPAERAKWSQTFLSRDAEITAAGRILVATQVVEAGVDLDAALLITELAPWPSLVQRFGRAARRGGSAKVIVVDGQCADDKAAAPYTKVALEAAAHALKTGSLSDVAPLALEAFEEALPVEERKRLYPYAPPQLLLRRDLNDLFDTTPDLSGADIDVGRFIRSGDDRDCAIAWVSVPGKDARPANNWQPSSDELCPAPFLAAREWLCGKDSDKLREDVRAWVWDWLDGCWVVARAKSLLPGRIVAVECGVGGYSVSLGFAASQRKVAVPMVPTVTEPSEQDRADGSDEGEALSEFQFKTIATHGQEVAAQARALAAAVAIAEPMAALLETAGHWHDLGKAHAAFQGSIVATDRPARTDLAKAPGSAWPSKSLYLIAATNERRRGFRHELASMLGLFATLRNYDPGHAALLGPWSELFAVPERTEAPQSELVAALVGLQAHDFDLLAYLVVSHHGKVRMSLVASPADQEFRATSNLGMPIRGVVQGDVLPPTRLGDKGSPLPALELSLEPANLGLSAVTGRSWAERAQSLLRDRGAFTLAFLEACLRSADVQASRLRTLDPSLAAAAEAES